MATEYSKSEEGNLIITKTETVAEEVSIVNLKEQIATLNEERSVSVDRIASIDAQIAERETLIAEAAKLGLIES